jgi:hypothetical protein
MITIVTPTIGRNSLPDLIDSTYGTEWQPDDEWFIVADSQRELPDWLDTYGKSLNHPFRYHKVRAEGSISGNSQRNWAISKARSGNYLIWADDNDTFTKGAISIIRDNLPETPQPVQFEVMFHDILRPISPYMPMNPAIGDWDIAGGGQQFITPNIEGKVAEWPNDGCSDYFFITDTLRLWGGPEALLQVPELIMHTS